MPEHPRQETHKSKTGSPRDSRDGPPAPAQKNIKSNMQSATAPQTYMCLVC